MPRLSPAEVARLDAHLKRGGGVVIGLGPTAAGNLDFYNRVLFADGNGLLPGKLLDVQAVAGIDDPGFRLAADEDSYRQPPLAAFRDDNARGGLTIVPFKQYVRIDAPADGRARRVLSFVPAAAARPVGRQVGPARPGGGRVAAAPRPGGRLHQHVQHRLDRLAACCRATCRSPTSCCGSPPPTRTGTPSASASRWRSSCRSTPSG